jgi:aspartate/methionine/tyrosine aminotransferase
LLADLPLSAVSQILTRAAAHGWSDVLPLAGGEPRFASPEGALQRLRTDDSDQITKYSPFAGQKDLLSAIREKLQKINGMDVHEDNILCVPGGSAAILGALMAVVDSGSEVVISDPCWEHYLSMVRLAGAVPRRFRMTFDGTRYTPDLDSLAAAIGGRTRAILLNTPLNPCGAVLRREEAVAIAELAASKNVWLIVDEEYETFVHGENVHFSAGSLDNNVISLYSFSKSFALTGVRLGYIVAPARIIDLTRRYALYSHMYPPSPSQRIAYGALSGDYVGYLRGVRAEYERLMQRLYDGIAPINGISCWKPEGGVYLFPRIDLPINRTPADVLIDDFHLLCVPGEVAGEMGRGHVRFFYGVTEGQIDQAVSRIRAMSETAFSYAA